MKSDGKQSNWVGAGDRKEMEEWSSVPIDLPVGQDETAWLSHSDRRNQ